MRFIFAFIFVLSGFSFAFGQNEQAPIVEKEIGYKDWTFKNLRGDGETNLRQFAKGKKLVMVVYWAPWCPNWRHDLAFIEQLHTKYGKDGLAVIGVGEYDTADRMKQHLEQFKLTFPSVYESTALTERLTNTHYALRTTAGDTRKWGSPWYVFLEPSKLAANGDVLANKVSVVNGELIKPEAEKFIREKLGLAAVAGGSVALGTAKDIELCDPAKQAAIVKPQ
jgi:thiol-disulfide isomerase/thioredoxin